MKKFLLFGICWLVGGIVIINASPIIDSIESDLNKSTKVYLVGKVVVSNIEQLSSQKNIVIVRKENPSSEIQSTEIKSLKKKNKKETHGSTTLSDSNSKNQAEKNNPQIDYVKSTSSDLSFSIFSNGKAKALRQTNSEKYQKGIIHPFVTKCFIFCVISEKKKIEFDFFPKEIDQIIGFSNRPRPSPDPLLFYI